MKKHLIGPDLPLKVLISPISNRIRIGFWIVGILLGIIQSTANLYTLSSDDIVAYLDVANLYLKGDWIEAVNGNWSPLYSWLLGLALGIFHATPPWEFPIVKLVNFLTYVLTFFGFEFLLREIILQIRNPELCSNREPENLYVISAEIPTLYAERGMGDKGILDSKLKSIESIWLALAYSLFIFSSLRWIGVNCDTPDMSTAGLIYLGSGLILRIKRQPQSWLNFLVLGGVLAFGYFSKAAMFPLAFVFILISLFSIGNFSKGLTKALATLLVFLLITGPYITALSIKKGHLTFSETGKLSYVWLVYPGNYQIPDNHWQGGPSGFGTPQHPSRKIFDSPEVFEFAEPIPGTYAPWTDPSYWYEGLTPQFNFGGLQRITVQNSLFYLKKFLGVFALTYLVLLYSSDRPKAMLRDLRENWQLLSIAIAGLGIYMVSTDFVRNTMPGQPSTRFIAAFVVVLFCGILSSIKFSTFAAPKKLTQILLLAIGVVIGFSISFNPTKILSKIVHRESNFHLIVATEIGKSGLKSGDKVAIFGDNLDHVFWARLARVRIIAQLPKADEFWVRDETTRAAILNKLKQAGAIAVVQKKMSDDPSSTLNTSNSDWQKVGKTGYYINLLK